MSSDNRLCDWIEHEASGEAIEAVAIGEPYRDELKERDAELGIVYGRPMPWEQARGLLAYTFDDGYGGAECHPVTVWTKGRIAFVCEYDGSTRMCSVPRNPAEELPGYM